MGVKIAILASGSGTNAENIIRYFRNNQSVEAALVISNKRDAYVLERARMLNVPAAVFSKQEFEEGGKILSLLKETGTSFIVLAGFLLRVPSVLLEAYPDKVINIHPALLPKFGGKGMYGNRVHEAVVAAGETESGITIHYVDEHYDSGNIIFQAKCPVLTTDSPEDVATKVHALEYKYFPGIIEEAIQNGGCK